MFSLFGWSDVGMGGQRLEWAVEGGGGITRWNHLEVFQVCLGDVAVWLRGYRAVLAS